MTVETAGERDRMIFYRGVGYFEPPVRPTVDAAGQVQIGDPRAIVLFENRGNNDGGAEVARQKLYAALVQSGLYPKEAHWMLETWRDSWFEEGLRVLYRASRVCGCPASDLDFAQVREAVRTFVGHIELLAPWMRKEIVDALRTGDTQTLARRGRFLQPFL